MTFSIPSDTFLLVTTVLTCALLIGYTRGDRRTGLRSAAMTFGVGTVVVYLWGLLYVFGAVLDAEDGGAESSPLRPCREAGMEAASTVIDYSVDFAPLRFNCEQTGGGSYTAAVPRYVNPAVLSFALGGAVLALASAVGAEDFRRTPPANRTPPSGERREQR